MKQYKSLASKYKEQPISEVFAHFPFNGKAGEPWDARYKDLANLAKPEDWNFKRMEFRDKSRGSFPILFNYLNYTFLRAQELGRIFFSKQGDNACFNTGLQTTREKDLFAVFYKNETLSDKADWVLFNFFDSYSNRLRDFDTLPEVSKYIDDPSDLVFDTNLDIEINYDHIINDNIDRLPEAVRENPRLAHVALSGAINSLKGRVIRNYKLAIPTWYQSHMTLLLPLNIIDESIADLALVVDKDKGRKIYRARTILTMDMAYMNARLITRPDSDWLNP
jgi:hypothetical protein